MKLKIVAISDTHNRHNRITIPECDVLIHCGDYSSMGYEHEIINFYKWLNIQKTKRIISIQGNHECLDKETELLTKRGWLNYKNINKDDKVLSINENGKSVWTNINNIILKKSEYIYKYHNTAIDLAITKNHRIAHYKRNWRSNKLFENLIYSDIEKINQDIAIPSSKPNINKNFKINEDLIKLLGWILTDGGFNKSNFVIYQSKPEGIKKIKDILNNLNFKYSLNFRKRYIKEICGKKVKTQLEQGIFIIKAEHTKILYKFIKENKIVNKELFNKFSASQLKILLISMMDGDGSWYKKSYKCGALNGSKQFLDWVQTLCVQSGIRSSLVEYRKNNFRLNLAFNYDNIEIRSFKSKINKTIYNDIVWCLSVPYTNFMVRRNGKAYFTGNCGWEKNPALMTKIAKEQCPRIILLNDSSTMIDGIKFYGTPVQPYFFNWAYNRAETDAEMLHYGVPSIKPHFEAIPNDINVLITHGPPLGILDEVKGREGQHLGSASLLEAVKRVKPDVHVFGHIHSGHGELHRDGTSFYNVAICDERYYPSNPVRVIEYV